MLARTATMFLSSVLVVAVAAKPATVKPQVRSEIPHREVEVDEKGQPHAVHAPDDHPGATSAMQVEVNEQGNVVNLGHANADVHQAHKAGDHEKKPSEPLHKSPAKPHNVEDRVPPKKRESELIPAIIPADDDPTRAPFEQDDEVDLALDELEAMTIMTALTKKNWTPPPAVNCEWGEWMNQGSCSKTCDGGKLKQVRERRVKAAHNGTDCEGSHVRHEKCHEEECPTTTTTMSTTMMEGGASGIIGAFPWATLFVSLTFAVGVREIFA